MSPIKRCLLSTEETSTDNTADDTARIESTLLSTDVEDTTASFISDTHGKGMEDEAADPTESSIWSGLEQNTPPQHEARSTTRRLSFPPRNLLYPSTGHLEPSSSIKQASASDESLVRPSTETQQDQYFSIAFREASRRTTGLRKPAWTVAPPAAQGKSKPDAEQSHRKSGSGSGGLLRSVVASAKRRKA